MRTRLTDMLNLEHPLIMAPMFLVSNTAMVIEGMRCGVAGCIPALNYRTLEELRAACRELKAAKADCSKGAYGFNLIVNKSNPKATKQLEVLCEEGCDFIITSLGSPEATINAAHKVGIKVFCDVTDPKFAQKVEALGADAVIAVNNEAGGHRGNISPKELIELLKSHCAIPVISAGGVNSGIFRLMVGPMLEGDLGGLKFAIANAQKDLRYFTHMTEMLPTTSYLAEAAHQSFVQATNLGLGDRFIASLFEAQETLNGTRIVPR